MASYFSRLNPVPAFTEYTGPFKVGTVDVEIPISELDSPSPAPETAIDIHTILFRIFYPATPDAKGKRISWLPAPQRLHVAAYTQFLGIGPVMASVLSFLPRHLHYTAIPAYSNATIESPDTPNGKWPTVIFSHGLGGSRNAYSHLAGSLASHGVVVVCPEHRDGSAVVSLIRDPHTQKATQGRFFNRSSATRSMIPYVRVPHTQTPEIWRARDTQLRIRLWELGLTLEAVLGIDVGAEHVVESNLNGTTPLASLRQFKDILDVHEPGKIIFGGHSFGAATIVQLLKTTYYADRPEIASMPDPLFAPARESNIRRLVTEKNPTILLDMWCFPLLSAPQAPLFRLPLPIYADDVPSAPGGDALLAVESESFYKWTEHLHVKARVLSPDPAARVVSAASFERPSSGVRLSEPHFFYVRDSAHLSQSDFGILFPWLCRRVFGAEEPERALRLNLRALLQHLRANDVHVARTWAGDLIDGAQMGKSTADGETGKYGEIKGFDDGVHDDPAILDRSAAGSIDAWCWIDIVGMGGESGPGEAELEASRHDGDEPVADSEDDPERQMEGQMEPAEVATGPEQKARVGAGAPAAATVQ